MANLLKEHLNTHYPILNTKKMNAYIITGYRTAVTRAKKGGFRFTRPDDLAADVIKHLVKETASIRIRSMT